jgi:hypothetical protein
MIKSLALAALVTIGAAPAFAQSYDPSVGSGNLNSVAYQKVSPLNQVVLTRRVLKSHAT